MSESTEVVVTKSHQELSNNGGTITVADEKETRAGPAFAGDSGLRFGVLGGVMPSLSVSMPSGLASRAGVGWAAHGDVVVAFGQFAFTAQYQRRYDGWDYAGGFGFGSMQDGYLGYLGYAPVKWLGLDVGAGRLAGRYGVGGHGNVLTESAFSLSQADASGMRFAARSTFFLTAGGYLQMQSAIRVEVGYHHLWMGQAPGIPPSAGVFTLGAELVLTYF